MLQLIVLSLCLLLAGCGFHLRDQNSLPTPLYAMTLDNNGVYDPLIRKLQQELTILCVQNDPRNRRKLVIHQHTLSERLVTIHTTNQVRVYTYEYTLSYSLKDGGNYLIKDRIIKANRQLMLAPTAIIETNDQKERMIEDLERAVIAQLINQLRAVPATRLCQ